MKQISTRSQPPRAVRQVLRRSLLAGLNGVGLRRLSVIAAPPGYGKTSLAGQWFAKSNAGGARARWISLSAEDGNLSHFMLSILTELDRAAGRPERMSDIATLSEAGLIGLVQTRFRNLRAALVLFLDDYHLAQSDAADKVMGGFLSDPGCAQLKLVLISRTLPHFPVSALRIAEEYRQIGIAELRFSKAEADEFLCDATSLVSPEQMERLTARAEGWPVALQMVRVLARENAAAAEMLGKIGRDTDMGRFLSEQVVSALPPEIRQFLLETAALPEVSADLAMAVTGRADAKALFFSLDDYALPQAMLDQGGIWVRFHPVFRDYLQEEAARSGIAAPVALRRAAQWFEAVGQTEDALRHALLAGDAALGAGILERAGGWRLIYLSFQGGGALFRALSDVAAQVDLAAFPLTTLGFAIGSAKAGLLEAANHYMTLAESRSDAKDVALQRQIRVVRALLSLYVDRRLSIEELSALEHDLTMDRNLELVHRGLVLNLLSFNYLRRTQLERAIVYGELAIRCMQDSGAQFGALHQHIHIGQAAFFAGNAASAEASYDLLIREAQTHIGPGSDLDAIGQVLRAELLVYRCDMPAAALALDWALDHVERHDAWFDVLAAGLIARQVAGLVQGDFTSVQRALDQSRRCGQRRGLDRMSRLADLGQIRMLLAAGDVQEARRFAQRSGLRQETATDRGHSDLSGRLRGYGPGLLWSRLFMDAGDPTAARATLDAVSAMQTGRLHILNRLEMDLLTMRLLQIERRHAEAAEVLTACVLALPLEDYRAAILMQGAQAVDDLVALSHSSAVPDPVCQKLARALGTMVEDTQAEATAQRTHLTQREQLILRLIGSGSTNKQIARQLDLTENTVKFHLRNAFAKLGANTRTGAIAAARQHGLLT